jgi:hypothetical protein
MQSRCYYQYRHLERCRARNWNFGGISGKPPIPAPSSISTRLQRLQSDDESSQEQSRSQPPVTREKDGAKTEFDRVGLFENAELVVMKSDGQATHRNDADEMDARLVAK